jgi:hypothetical protein
MSHAYRDCEIHEFAKGMRDAKHVDRHSVPLPEHLEVHCRHTLDEYERMNVVLNSCAHRFRISHAFLIENDNAKHVFFTSVTRLIIPK